MSLRTNSLRGTWIGLAAVLLLVVGCGQTATASQPATPTASTERAAVTPTMQTDMTMVAPTTNGGAAAAPTVPADIKGPAVVIDNFTFGPQTITVTVGSTVTWVNQDDTAHTVTSVDKVFGSAALDTGDRFSFQFNKPGTYKYYCTIHPTMTGTVIVQ